MSSQIRASDFSPSRRHFIVSTAAGGGLLLGFGLPLLSRPATAAATNTPVVSSTINTWIQIGSDESITILVGSSDMGQGALSGLAQIVAEELMVDWSTVKAIEAPASPLYGNPAFGGGQVTGGSNSVRGYYDALRTAGAAAREMLITAAANSWGISASVCSATNGTVVRSDTKQTLSYGILAQSAATLPPPANPPLTSPGNFRLLGKPVPRLDLPQKVNGSAVYGIDVVVPGMVYAAIVHCPSIGGTCSALPQTPQGASAVVNLGNAVAVVADSTWNAFQAANAMRGNIQWNVPASAAAINSAQIFLQAQQLVQHGTALVAETQGNVSAALAVAAKVLDLTYDAPTLPMPRWRSLTAPPALPQRTAKSGRSPRCNRQHWEPPRQ